MRAESVTFNEICKNSMIIATKALSRVVHIPIGLHIETLELNNIEDIQKLINENELTVNLIVPIKGKIPGVSFFLYTQKTALSICDLVLKRNVGLTKLFTEMEISALSEVANIVIGNFLTSFANSLQIDMLIHRPASFECAPFKEIYAQIKDILTNDIKKPFLKISFGFQHTNLQGHIIIAFDKKVIVEVLKKIGVEVA